MLTLQLFSWCTFSSRSSHENPRFFHQTPTARCLVCWASLCYSGKCVSTVACPSFSCGSWSLKLMVEEETALTADLLSWFKGCVVDSSSSRGKLSSLHPGKRNLRSKFLVYSPQNMKVNLHEETKLKDVLVVLIETLTSVGCMLLLNLTQILYSTVHASPFSV